jgi:hypothetical protein
LKTTNSAVATAPSGTGGSTTSRRFDFYSIQ